MPIHDITEIRYEIARNGEVPLGRAVQVVESAGRAIAYIHPDHCTEELCEQLTAQHRPALAYSLWVQDWDGDPYRADKPAEGKGIARAWWEFAPPDALAPGYLCCPGEIPGVFVWMIRPGEASQQLIDEMTAYSVRLIGDGLWRQNWRAM